MFSINKFLYKYVFNPHQFTFYLGGDEPAPQQPSSQTVTQTSIPEYAKPYVERMLGKAEAITNAPYQAYGGERIAGFTPMQQQAMQGVANLAPSKQLGIGTQMAGLGSMGALGAGNQYNMNATNPYAQQAFMSPYIQNALNPQMMEAQRQSDIMAQKNNAQAVQAGAFGGGRQAIVDAERQRNLGQNLANIYGTGMQNAFQQAQQAQQFGATLGLQGNQAAIQGAQTLGQLGQTQFGQQKDILNAQMNAGAQQQGLQQQKLQQQYQDFLNQKGYDRQNISFMSDVLRGVPLGQTTQQQYTAPASLGAQLGGAALTYAGAKQSGLFAEGGSVSHGLDRLAVDQLMRG
jgi:hypothetical protein